MPIPISDLQGFSPSAIIELFELQLVQALHGATSIYRFHAGASLNANGPVVWNGNSYDRIPIEAEGFDYTGNGQLPQPKVRVSNINGTISSYLALVNTVTPGNDLIGAKFVRIRTLARYLDAANFPARRNLLINTDEFSAASWTKVRSTTVANSSTGPLGEATADLLREDGTANNTHYIEQTITGLASATQYAFSIYIKPSGRNFVRLELSGGGAFTTAQSAVFDLVRNAPTRVSGTPSPSADFLSTGWVRCQLTATTNTTGSVTVRVYLQATASTNSYSGNSTSGVLLSDSQFEQSTVTTYQDIGSTFSQNPFGTPDPTVEFPREIYYITQKSAESRELVEFTLASSFDLQGVRAPKRQCISNICQWVYRSAECSYTGTNYYDANDNPVGSAALDVCGKRLSSCALRFASTANLSTIGTISTLNTNGVLLGSSNQQLVAANGWYRLTMQSDGNLVLYTKAGLPLWSSQTNMSVANDARLVMQPDGNLVVYKISTNTAVWASNTGGSGATKAIMQNDGNLVLYTASNVAVWATDTASRDEPTRLDIGLPYGSFPGVGTFFA